MQLKFPAMTRALEKAGRNMLFSICEWGVNNPAAWAGGRCTEVDHAGL